MATSTNNLLPLPKRARGPHLRLNPCHPWLNNSPPSSAAPEAPARLLTPAPPPAAQELIRRPIQVTHLLRAVVVHLFCDCIHVQRRTIELLPTRCGVAPSLGRAPNGVMSLPLWVFMDDSAQEPRALRERRGRRGTVHYVNRR